MKIKQKNQILIDANTPSLSKIKKNNRIKNKRVIKQIMKGNKIHKKMEKYNKMQSTRKRENRKKNKTKI